MGQGAASAAGPTQSRSAVGSVATTGRSGQMQPLHVLSDDERAPSCSVRDAPCRAAGMYNNPVVRLNLALLHATPSAAINVPYASHIVLHFGGLMARQLCCCIRQLGS